MCRGLGVRVNHVPSNGAMVRSSRFKVCCHVYACMYVCMYVCMYISIYIAHTHVALCTHVTCKRVNAVVSEYSNNITSMLPCQSHPNRDSQSLMQLGELDPISNPVDSES